MKALRNKETKEWISLPEQVSVPQIWNDRSEKDLKIIIPKLAKQRNIPESNIELIEVAVIEKPTREELWEKAFQYHSNWKSDENDYRDAIQVMADFFESFINQETK